jgi:hypothetical protein
VGDFGPVGHAGGAEGLGWFGGLEVLGLGVGLLVGWLVGGVGIFVEGDLQFWPSCEVGVAVS